MYLHSDLTTADADTTNSAPHTSGLSVQTRYVETCPDRSGSDELNLSKCPLTAPHTRANYRSYLIPGEPNS
jgi:hypothetical protein